MKTPVPYPLLGAWLLSTAMALAPQDNYQRAAIYPGPVQNGLSDVQFTSESHGLDGPNLSLINDSVFEWWSFFTYDPKSNASLVVNFFMATSDAVPLLPQRDSVLTSNISGTYPNGTVFGASANAVRAVIETRGNGSSGNFEGTGFSWKGSPDMTKYEVTVNEPDLGINGSLTLKSRAPPHTPCGPASAGENMEIIPHLGYFNAIPAAEAQVNFTIAGTPLTFDGDGGADNNWGDLPFNDSVRSTLRGSGYVSHSLGTYHLVWVALLAPDGQRTVSAYAALAGKVIKASCDGLQILLPEDNSSGYKFKMNLDEYGALVVNVKPSLVTLQVGTVYERALAELEGTLNGLPVTGNAMIDAFSL